MASKTVKECCKALATKGWTIVFVESASAGKMSYEFSTVPNSGKILIGGMICYHTCMKESVLEIPRGLINTFTPESAEVTRAMANNFSKFVEANVCVALTGLTTAGGSESREKPVGTIFICIILPNKKIEKRFEFKGDAKSIVNQAINATALEILKEIH
jgi:nicotinamide-nucleotide amidase